MDNVIIGNIFKRDPETKCQSAQLDFLETEENADDEIQNHCDVFRY